MVRRGNSSNVKNESITSLDKNGKTLSSNFKTLNSLKEIGESSANR